MKSYLLDINSGEVWDDELGWNNNRASLHTSFEWSQIEYQHNQFLTASLFDKRWDKRKFLAIEVNPIVQFEVLT